MRSNYINPTQSIHSIGSNIAHFNLAENDANWTIHIFCPAGPMNLVDTEQGRLHDQMYHGHYLWKFNSLH